MYNLFLSKKNRLNYIYISFSKSFEKCAKSQLVSPNVYTNTISRFLVSQNLFKIHPNIWHYWRSDTSQRVHTRRFFLVDNLSGRKNTGEIPQQLQYAQNIDLHIRLSDDGQIYYPVLKVLLYIATLELFTPA